MEEKKLRALDPLLYPDEDMLHKDAQFIDRFYDLIEKSIQPPYAISVDGLWGTGKTTVMKLLEDKLKKEGYPVFWFNPWKYRQSENVVMAFLQCLAAEHDDKLKPISEGGGILTLLTQPGMDAGLRVITGGFITLNDVKAAFFRLVGQDSSDLLKRYRNVIGRIEEEFTQLIGSISKDHEDKPVIIFFDDLDRCSPEDAIQLLEALKNLFVVSSECRSIFICGIDTRIAKQFITKHYDGIEDMFSINYFRKIFNLTLSMPYSPCIGELLERHVRELYEWHDPGNRKTKALAAMVDARCLQTQIYSVRKHLNVITNFYVFLKFNPDYRFEPENFDPRDDFIINLLILKEAWHPLYEKLIGESLRDPAASMEELVDRLIRQEKLLPDQEAFLTDYLGDDSPFADENLSKKLTEYPALA
ncbi:MAG: hypothetical protein DRI57_31285 [Deltaproteobacteria bacterium]|nr:MAG: hypothetical protein DRI57_31285 [Deltaproteobacteria bacterium]